VRDRSVYEFGDVRVDTGRMAALRGDTAIPLEPKAFDVLLHLIEHRDRLVTKDELLDAVWPGTFVTPNVLTRAVAQARRALGDESQDARFIETVAKRGYRFIAPVTVINLDPRAGALPALDPPRATPPTGSIDSTAGRLPFRTGRWVAALAFAAVALGLTVAFRAWDLGTARFTAPPTDLQLKRFTNRRGYTGMGTLSPDGRSMVYSSDVSGGLELYLVSLAPGSAEVPLTRDGGHNVEPAWSPDGQWIAYHSVRLGGVWILPSSGGTPQQVVEFGSDPSWSPDSSTIVFTSDAGGLVGQSSLWTVRRDGSDRRALTKIGTPAGGHRAPAWSHDGRSIAFIVSTGGWKTKVWTLNLASGEQHFIDESTGAADPCFTPDDRALLWGGMTPTANARIFRRTIDAEARPLGVTESVLPMDSGSVGHLSMAANGTLSFTTRTLDANLWAIDISADARVGEPIRLTDDLSRLTRPAYSREGRVAYMQTAVGSLPSVWIMRDDGTGRSLLTPGVVAGDPHWDPSGNRVLIVRGSPESQPELAWVDLASRRITPTGLRLDDMRSPRLSADGKTVVFHRIEKTGILSVWLRTFDGAETRIATDPEAVSYPAWSPDGQALAVEIKRGDSTHIGWVPRAGGPIVQLTNERGQSWPHSWAPDNDRIAFAGQRNGVWNTYTVSRRTGTVTPLTSFRSAAGYVRYPAWSLSGSRIVFERAIETANVWTATLPIER
jgi:Tol biopolymer transport system component/DNA-binding winged helix-turn-helix (wHTH) protein